MKISVDEVNRLLAFTPSDRSVNRSANQAPAPAGGSTMTSEAATVDVSTSAQEIQQIKRIVNSVPDVREERVQALKAQIENGTYKVSGEDIADLIIRRMLADSAAL